MAAGFLLGGFFLGARGQRDAKGEEGEDEAHGGKPKMEDGRWGIKDESWRRGLDR
jgi:hypothetical protein